MANDCTALNRIDPAFAAAGAPACAKHDYRYRQATLNVLLGRPRGSRIAADIELYEGWLGLNPHPAGWRFVWWDIRTVIYTGFVLMLGWVLWYDLDRKVEKLWDRLKAAV